MYDAAYTRDHDLFFLRVLASCLLALGQSEAQWTYTQGLPHAQLAALRNGSFRVNAYGAHAEYIGNKFYITAISRDAHARGRWNSETLTRL